MKLEQIDVFKSTEPDLEQRIAALKSKKKNFIIIDKNGYKKHYEYIGKEISKQNHN